MTDHVQKSRSAQPNPAARLRMARVASAAIVVTTAAAIVLGSIS
ncbi:MAG TPA: hypothetical protein VIV06_10880 [Candidatus Limnocylindrales bacterium]